MKMQYKSNVLNQCLQYSYYFSQYLLLLLLLLPMVASAANCFSPSPSIKQNIDIYEPIQATELSREQNEMVSQIFKRITGSWVGTTTSIICKGTLDAIDEKSTEYDAEVEIETLLRNGIKISNQLHSRQDRKKVQDTLQLYLSKQRLGITENSAVGDVQIVNLTRNFLVYLRKFVVRTVAGSAIATEEIRSLAIYDHRLMMEYLVFSNGLLAEKMTWTLQRK